MHDLGVEIIHSHGLTLPAKTVIMCKHSVRLVGKLKFVFVVPFNTERIEKNKGAYLVHVDNRLGKIRGAYLSDLLKREDLGYVTFPYIVDVTGGGKRHNFSVDNLYWKELATLTDIQREELAALRHTKKFPGQQLLF
jgi:hypothetical protein